MSPAAAQGDAGSPGEAPEQQLADRFAPIVMLQDQDGECDRGGEPCGPASVEIVLDNPAIALRQVGPSDPVVRWGPGARDLYGLGEGRFLVPRLP